MAAFPTTFSLSTSALSGELDEKLSAISRAGFDGVILAEHDVITFAANAADVGELVAEHELRVDLYQVELPESVTSRGEDSILARMDWTFTQMRALGASLLELGLDDPVFDDGVSRPTLLARIADTAAKAGIRVGLRPEPRPSAATDIAAAHKAILTAARPNLGIVLDSHLMTIEGVMAAIGQLPAEHIFQVIVSDATFAGGDADQAPPRFRDVPGEGELPLPDFAQTIAELGYAGSWGVEISGPWTLERANRLAASDAFRALVHLIDDVARRTGRTLHALEGVPAASAIKGIEFVEFTADELEARTLGAQLRSMGFSPIGQHVNKRVTLWRQGEINIVINTEKSGFAHSAYVTHGTSVCDLGLLVEDASAAIARAQAFGASVFTQRRGEGELDIPAVRGLGGSVMHFLDKRSELAEVWDTEFRRMEGAEPAPEVGLSRIDHVAQTMSRAEMVHWTLFNLAVFDVSKTRTLGVADPAGLVPSRAVANDDGSFRLTMNAADTHHTFAGRFVEGRHGSSFQHIAFASSDLIATAAALEHNGFVSLRLPEDYYDDLATRFDLDPDFVEILKSHSILYDRDEDGDYFQLYSTPYSEGFFFEIVERRGQYAGYGAWNAPYRTAALKDWAE